MNSRPVNSLILEGLKAPSSHATANVELEQLSHFFELSIDMLCIVGFDGYFKVLNTAWEATLGFSREELLARPYIEFVHAEDRDLTIAEAKKLAAGGSTVSFENRCRCKDGSYRWLLWNATALLDQEVIYAAARDITDRKQTEAELQRSNDELETRVRDRTFELTKSNSILLAEINHCRQMERLLWEAQEKYRSIFDNAVEGIFQSTPDGTYLSVNPALAHIKGYESPEELVKSIDDIGQQSYVDPHRRIEFKSLMEKHGVVTGFEYQAYRKDGQKIWLSMNARAVRNFDGALLYYEGTIEDITGRKQLASQLCLAQKMEAVGQLAGGIAHDFNNLLNVIIGYGDLLLENLDEGHPLRAHAEQINKASQRAASLAGRLLTFGRKPPGQPIVLNLNTVVASVEKMLSSVVGEDITLTTVLDPALECVKVDQGQMEQVIVNLVVNARDAMPRGGRLTIETANVQGDDAYPWLRSHISLNSGVMLTVTDTGVGMDVETQSHIFEPFFTTKARGKGTGLGLATAYGVVKQSGGFIWVQSELGRGTTFKILLPKAEATEAETGEEIDLEASDGGSETVLLVEDDGSLRELTRKLLVKQGYKVLEAANGSQALSIVRRFSDPIHLLLTDVVMPNLSGPKLADDLASLRPSLKVLYMSGYTEFAADHERLSRQEGLLLKKPFSQRDLACKVREVLEAS